MTSGSENSDYEVVVKKFAVGLDQTVVERMRDEARRRAVREGKDITWVYLLRIAVNQFLSEVEREKKTLAVGGGR